MWVITHIHSGNTIFLISGREYAVGRVGSDIVLEGDTSISRSHALLHVSDESIKLQDKGSKYGTYHNEQIENKQKLPKGKPIDLKQGDRILFGALKNEWLISRNNIRTMVSSLGAQELIEVKSQLDILGGNIISKWEPICSHLTMSEITITIKVLHALIEKIPIVSCSFWKDYVRNVQNKHEPPLASRYLPKRSSLLSSAIRDEHLRFNEGRKTLFAGKTFVFMTKKHYDIYSPIVVKAGGQCKDLKNNVHKSFLIKKNVIVVQYVASTQSQGSQIINTISDYLESNSLRTIPEYEIGLAIVCCTIEKYCNPSYSTLANILPESAEGSPNIGTLLAENTGSQKSQFNTLIFAHSDVPESNCPVSSKPYQSEVYDSEVVIIDDKSMSPNSMGSHSIIPESGTLSNMSKKVTDIEEDEIENLKSINFSDEDFSGNLLLSSDMNSNKASNTAESSQPNEKRKRPTTPNDTGLVSTKKARVSPPPQITNNKPTNKEIQNLTKEPGPSLLASKKHILPGFLQKSQIINVHSELQDVNIGKQSNNRPSPAKRGRIALITDNDSDDDNDIFNFGSSPKKTKPSGDNSEEDELFDFWHKASRDEVDGTEKNMQEASPKTETFLSNKKANENVAIRKIKVSPITAAPGGWLSVTSIVKIKNQDDEVKKEVDLSLDDLKQKEWIDSLKEGFEIRVRKMNLSSKKSNCSSVQDSSSTSLFTNKKNFKAFVKKHNYKTQTQIIKTIPTVVPPIC